MKLGRKLTLVNFAPLTLTLALGVVCIWSINSLVDSNGWVDHTHKVIAEAKAIEASAVNMETGMRGYLLAGKESFLDPYKQGGTEFKQKINELKKTVSENPQQVRLLGEIESTIDQWRTKVTEPTIALRREVGDSENMTDMAKLVGQARGKSYFDKFRGQIATFSDRERALMVERQEAAKNAQTVASDSLATVEDTTSWVKHTYKVISKAKEILASAMDMENGMRGFMLAGKDEFLDPFNGGKREFARLITEMKETVSDNPQQVKLLGDMESTINTWRTQVAEPSIAARRNVGSGVTMDQIATLVGQARGKRYLDAFRQQVATFIERESALLVEREKAGEEASSRVADSIKAISDTAGWVDHTHEVIAKAESLLASAVDMETGMRGYLLAGQDSFLEPYTNGSARFTSQATDLKETVSDNPPQVALIGEIEKTISEWKLNVTEPMIQTRRRMGDASTMDDMADLISESRGNQYFDKFRDQIATFTSREQALMKERQAKANETADAAWSTVVLGTITIFGLTLCLSAIMVPSVTRPIKRTVSMLKDIAEGEGDLTKRLDDSRSDELGEMAKWFNVFVDKLHGIVGKLSQDASTLNGSSRELSGVASELAMGAEGASGKSSAVAAAAEEMAANMNSMASSTEQVSATVKNVAVSLDEMKSSISEVAQNAEKAASVAADAAELAQTSNDKIADLGTAADEIGKVIEVIQDIAEQTNLLALNATIEAARAGDAGKGFAVVATEVKELARQTAAATDDIRTRIEGIQNSTGGAVEAVKEIGDVISHINEVSRTIAAAVEQQSASTKQIAENVSQTAAASESVSRGVAESATASQEITVNINEVNQVLRQTTEGAQRSRQSGESLNSLAQHMEQVVSQFKTDASDNYTVTPAAPAATQDDDFIIDPLATR